jgi:hypothetical protein
MLRPNTHFTREHIAGGRKSSRGVNRMAERSDVAGER